MHHLLTNVRDGKVPELRLSFRALLVGYMKNTLPPAAPVRMRFVS